MFSKAFWQLMPEQAMDRWVVGQWVKWVDSG